MKRRASGAACATSGTCAFLRDQGIECERRKVEPDITPDMPKAQVYAELEKASGNADVEKCALLWRLVDEVLNGEEEVSGRLQVHRTENGRVIRMVGLRGWRRGGTCKR